MNPYYSYKHRNMVDVFMMVRSCENAPDGKIKMDVLWFTSKTKRYIGPDTVLVRIADLDNWRMV